MAKKNKAGDNENIDEKKDEKKEDNKVLTILMTILLVIVWLAFFGGLIKLDFGGFGSNVLRPILKDIPIVNMILPTDSTSATQKKEETREEYASLAEALAKIKELEQTVDEQKTSLEDKQAKIKELQAEVKKLKVFEDNQKTYEKNVAEFDKNVVFADNAPSIEEYKKYYEEIDPTNAAKIYQQVVEQLQYSEAVQEKADIYKNMDPAAAASVFETMSADTESVAEILLCMKPKESSAIIAEMDPVVAAKITKKMLDMDAERLNK